MKKITALEKMSLEKPTLNAIYGGRTVERSVMDFNGDGVDDRDKIITRNNGSVKVRMYIS